MAFKKPINPKVLKLMPQNVRKILRFNDPRYLEAHYITKHPEDYSWEEILEANSIRKEFEE